MSRGKLKLPVESDHTDPSYGISASGVGPLPPLEPTARLVYQLKIGRIRSKFVFATVQAAQAFIPEFRRRAVEKALAPPEGVVQIVELELHE